MGEFLLYNEEMALIEQLKPRLDVDMKSKARTTHKHPAHSASDWQAQTAPASFRAAEEKADKYTQKGHCKL